MSGVWAKEDGLGWEEDDGRGWAKEDGRGLALPEPNKKGAAIAGSAPFAW